MRYARLAWRMAIGIVAACLIALMAAYLWLQDEFLKAKDEFDAA